MTLNASNRDQASPRGWPRNACIRLSQRVACAALLVAAAIAAAQPARAAELDAFTAEYEARANGFRVGSVSLQLKPTGNGEYEYRQVSATRGLGSLFGSNDLVESSQLRFDGKQLEAIEYQSKRKGGDDEENARFVFDRTAGKVLSRGAGPAWSIPIQDGLIDPLMVRLAMMVDLARGARSLEYAVPRQGRIKTYTFRVAGNETIRIGSRRYDTIKVERTDDKEDKTSLWHAPDLGYLPIRIVKDKRRGTDTEVILQDVRIRPVRTKSGGPSPPPKTQTPKPSPEAAPANGPSAGLARPNPDRPSGAPTPAPASPPRSARPQPPAPTPASEAAASASSETARMPDATPPGRTATEPISSPVHSPNPSPKPSPMPPAAPVLISVADTQAAVLTAPGAPTSPDRPATSDSRTPASSAVKRAACPGPRRISKRWHWITRPVGGRCSGKLAFASWTRTSS